MTILVDLTAALLCINASCFPVLVGEDTPTGTFFMNERLTSDKGYSGNVIQFYENEHKVYAIHRLWKLNPSQHREQRIKSGVVSDRTITSGCINVEDFVFEKILDCCIMDKLVIKK